MLNVIDFREKAPRSRNAGLPRQLANVSADISELASRIARLRPQAREEICNAILMLDLAAQCARQIAKSMCDPATRRNFEERIATIESLLQIARGMALRL